MVYEEQTEPIAETPQEVLRRLPNKRINNQSIARLASSFVFVYQHERVFDLLDAMRSEEKLQAVGVVDDEERVVGMVVRRDFFATMARPYAQDVFRNHPVSEIMSVPRMFNGDANLFSVADEIDEEMRLPGVSYYLLTFSGDRFAGVFSSQDMLVYLSHITQSDIALARKLQARIVREREFVVGKRLEVIAASRTAKGVGGDFYEIREYSPGRWVIAMCDVSGKGVAASIITSVLWGMMSIYDFNDGMVPFIKKLNNYLVRTFETEKFVTAVFLDYDESTGNVEVCDLGHSHLFMYRGGKMLKIKTNQNNLPIGIVQDIEPRVDRFTPHPEDLVFLITDGLVEQENEMGEEYSMNQVSEVFAQHGKMPVEVISDRLLDDFNKFRGKRALSDDVSWTLMRFTEQDVTL